MVRVTIRQGGFTLMEISIVTFVLTLVLGSLVTVVLDSGFFSGEYTQRLIINQTGRRIMERLREELRAAEPSTVMPVLIADSDFVQFQKVEGYKNDAVLLSPVITIRRQPTPIDQIPVRNQGQKRKLEPDGTISPDLFTYDEGLLTSTEEGSPPLGIAGKVLGLRFNAIPNGLSFSVDIGLVNRDDVIVQKTFTEQVIFRN